MACRPLIRTMLWSRTDKNNMYLGNVLILTNTSTHFTRKKRLGSCLLPPQPPWGRPGPSGVQLSCVFMICTDWAEELWGASVLPACSWHGAVILEVPLAMMCGPVQTLPSLTAFCDRCSQWTPATVFLKCTQIKRYQVLEVKLCLLPWIISCVHDAATGNESFRLS